MAAINNARLAIQENLPGGNVRADVTCQIRFDQLELFLMQNGLRFRLDCKLWGSDSILNPDDDLFTYPRKSFPDGTPSLVENVSFSAVMRSSTLNEDDYIGNREDEIYGKLILRRSDNNVKISKKTNQIDHHF